MMRSKQAILDCKLFTHALCPLSETDLLCLNRTMSEHAHEVERATIEVNGQITVVLRPTGRPLDAV